MGTSTAADKLTPSPTPHKRSALKIANPSAVEITSSKIEKILKGALLHLPDLIAVAVVEVATGTCLAHHSRSRGFDSAVAAGHNAAIVRQKQAAMVALNMRGERLEDILIPFRKQLHLIRLAKNGQWFVYLAVNAKDTSLALAREILKTITY